LAGAAVAILVTKAAVAVATVGNCQKTIGLFTVRTLAPIVLAAGAGAGLYWGLRPFVFRELAEFAAIAPMLLFLWRHWRGQRRTAPCA
jgi:hypothetical protein